MTYQFDLFAAPPAPRPAPPPAPVARPDPYPWPNAHLRPPRRISTIAAPSPESLAAMAAIALIGELPPVVPGAFPRVAVGRDGWDRAMEHRRQLVLRQLAGTIAPGDSEALSALTHIQLQQVDFATAGPVIVTASAYEHLADALAGLRCAAQEDTDV